MESKKREEKEVGFVRILLALSFILHKFAKNSLLLDPARGAAVVVKDNHINVNIG